LKFLKINSELQAAITELEESAGSTCFNLGDPAGARAMNQSINEQRLAAQPKREIVNIETKTIYDEEMDLELEVQTYGIKSTAQKKLGYFSSTAAAISLEEHKTLGAG
jgi:hypothetical protein